MKHLIFCACICFMFMSAHKPLAQTTETGLASFYSDRLNGKKTASGAIFDNDKYTAAHRTLPFNSKVKVTNLQNNISVVVTINDRGPFSKTRIIDVTKAAAKTLNFVHKGTIKVKLEVLE